MGVNVGLKKGETIGLNQYAYSKTNDGRFQTTPDDVVHPVCYQQHMFLGGGIKVQSHAGR
jgi:hypothetical protein